jgi:hypothetical protein
MQDYLQYSLGRTAELGFAAAPLSLWTGQYLTGLIDNSGLPTSIVIYEMPAERHGGGYFADWPSLFATLTPAFLTGAGWNPALGQDLPQTFQAYVTQTQAYAAYAIAAMAPLVDEGAPGAPQAWSWLYTNVYQPMPWSQDPSWDIVPRTDANTLPAQSTVLQ